MIILKRFVFHSHLGQHIGRYRKRNVTFYAILKEVLKEQILIYKIMKSLGGQEA